MTQAELNAVARATGEDVETIEQRGFSLVEAFPEDVFEFETADMPAQCIDWDGPSGATQSFYESC